MLWYCHVKSVQAEREGGRLTIMSTYAIRLSAHNFFAKKQTKKERKKNIIMILKVLQAKKLYFSN